MLRFLFSITSLFISTITLAQKAPTFSSADILHQIKKLSIFGSVLYIAAHPDDENTRLLGYLANEKKYRTGYLSLTRGDGGQNLIGDEQGIELGLIRTQELLAARRVDGAEQYFTRAYDFGYSKTPEETLKIWGQNNILADVVWAIRKFKPDVIITRFPTTGEGGHGHHTASAILAGVAFDAAADPAKYPEQLKLVTTWQAKRLLWNTFNFGGNNTQRENQFKIDCGLYNALLGKNYGEIAAESRSNHKSQGFGVPAQRGKSIEYFSTIKGTAPAINLLDGVDSGLFKTDIAIQYFSVVKDLVKTYEIEAPEKSIKKLMQLRNIAANWEYIPQQRKNEIDNLIINCAGIFFEALSANQINAIGDTLALKFNFINRSSIKIENVSIQCLDAKINITDIKQNELKEVFSTQYLAKNKTVSQPHFLVNQKDIGSYIMQDQQEVLAPEINRVQATFKLKLEEGTISFDVPIKYKYTDPVKGELYQPMQIVYPAFITITPSLLLFSNQNKNEKKQVEYLVQANTIIKDKVALFSTKDNNSTLVADTTVALAKNSKVAFSTLINSNDFENESTTNIGAKLLVPTFYEQQSATLHKINYEHIPDIFYNYQSKVKILKLNLKTEGSKAGYIAGAGDKVPQALEQMGYTVTLLTDKDINAENLKNFDVIITGVRAYNVHAWLSVAYPILMQYVKDGGVLLTQYNTNNSIGPIKANMAPYPFTITRNRITDETAAVNFLLPNHPALNYPNKITNTDFEGWVQERSIYNAEMVDNTYQKILSMKDPNEAAQEGTLIVSNYGKGRYIYTGLVFFRELPAGVSGAYRLFANLIANKR